MWRVQHIFKVLQAFNDAEIEVVTSHLPGICIVIDILGATIITAIIIDITVVSVRVVVVTVVFSLFIIQVIMLVVGVIIVMVSELVACVALLLMIRIEIGLLKTPRKYGGDLSRWTVRTHELWQCIRVCAQ